MRVLGVIFILLGAAISFYFMAVVGSPSPNTDEAGAFAAGLAILLAGVVFVRRSDPKP